MKIFDYASAWHDLAIPAYNVLPDDVHALYARTVRETQGLSQLKDLSMPWPSPEFREAFRAIETETLARAARAINSCGHWKPGASHCQSSHAFPGTDHGAHWKFSHYADQELSERLGVSRSNASSPGYKTGILEGYLRVCYETRDSWRWDEVGPATVSLLEKCNALPGIRFKGTREQKELDVDAGLAAARALRDPSDGFLTLEGFMREECSD
jgi:hypothetical protein